MMQLLMRLYSIILDLFYPRRAVCLGCGDMVGCDRDDLCESCRGKLAESWVGLRQPQKGSPVDGAAYGYFYAGPAGSLVRHLKYGGVSVLAEQMGDDIARAAMLLRIENECFVTAVPMHPKRLRLRGVNHAELLAKRTAVQLGLDYQPVLARTRNAPQQARLNRDERKRNLKGGFSVPDAYRDIVDGAEVLLIDDVFTTGATAAACAEALREAGAYRVYFAAYAYGERKKNG